MSSSSQLSKVVFIQAAIELCKGELVIVLHYIDNCIGIFHNPKEVNVCRLHISIYVAYIATYRPLHICTHCYIHYQVGLLNMSCTIKVRMKDDWTCIMGLYTVVPFNITIRCDRHGLYLGKSSVGLRIA